MSGWDAYINTLLESHPTIRRGAIIGLDASIWARSEGENQFKASAAELATLLKGFEDTHTLPQSGADLEGVHYVVPRVEEKLIFGKKGSGGFFAAKTEKAVIIAVYEETGSTSTAPPQVRTATERLATYLVELGY